MPDIKFSQLDQLDIAVTADYIPIVDASDVTMGINGTNKTITLDNLANSIFNLSGTVEFDASQITSGTFAAARIPSLNASKINDGIFNDARIPNLDASKITSGIIDAARLPSYVDDVLEFANVAAFPVTGEISKIYIALDTNATYRWSGSVYIQINADQTITLTSDVTGSGTGSFATTIAAGAVSLAKMANVATSTVFYRKTSGTGDPEVQSLATLKTDLGLTGTNSGDQTITLTGAVTGSGTGSFATTIAAGAVSLAKMANVATSTVFYRKTSGTGDPEVQSLATLKTDLGLTGTNSGDQDLSGLVTKLTPSEYTVTNGPTVPVKTFNASTATIDDVYNVLATLIQTLKDRQII